MDAIEIALLPEPESGEDVPVERVAVGGKKATATRDRGYAFWIPDLVPGRYLVGLKAGGGATYRPAGKVVVETDSGETSIAVPAPDRAEMLVVRATGPDGKPLRGFTAHGTYAEEGENLAVQASQSPVEDGACFILFRKSKGGGLGLPPFDPGRGRFRVLVQCGHGAIVAECTPSAEPEVAVAFQAAASLRITVDGLASSPFGKDLDASLCEAGSGRWSLQRPPGNPFHAGGRFELEAVQPGDYAFVIRNGIGIGSFEVLRAPVTVGGAGTEMRLALPGLHRVRVLGAGGTGFLLERLEVPGWKEYLNTANMDGVRPLDGLAEGHYRASRGDRIVEFVVPGTDEVDLRTQ